MTSSQTRLTGEVFRFALDTTIVFGPGCRREIGTVAAQFGPRVALVGSRTGYVLSQYRADIEQSVADAGGSIVLRAVAAAEPTLKEVVALADDVVASACDVLVAVGGGSTLDLAKAAAVATAADVTTLIAGARYEGSGLPVVTMPTTAGSGAEVSRGAIVTDEAMVNKRGIRGRGVAARVALVDPELVVGCDARVTAVAGFDAVAHAIETAASRAATPLTQLLSEQALVLLMTQLPRSIADGRDLEARTAASYAALLAGINLANSTTCLPHRMQYPVGALTRTNHALGVAALMPAWLSRLQSIEVPGLNALAAAIGVRAGITFTETVLTFMDSIGMRVRLADLGVQRSDLGRLTEMVEGSVENDPGPNDRDAIYSLYLASL